MKGISDSGDAGRPIVLDEGVLSAAFMDMAKSVAQQVAICNARVMGKENIVNN